jgi:hypothetical protein
VRPLNLSKGQDLGAKIIKIWGFASQRNPSKINSKSIRTGMETIFG